MSVNKQTILFEDEYYIAALKPAGILVHPYKQKDKDRRHLMRSLKKQTGHYLYPVHRLDKPVSGVVIFGLSKEATSLIKENWGSDTTKKYYKALCKGEIEESGTFDFDLKTDKGIQSAITHYQRISTNGEYSFVDIQIETGRKHQIRKHFSRRMHNLIGDSKYGRGEINRYFKEKYKFFRLFLHAYKLEFIHPITGENIIIEAPLPEELTKILEQENLINSAR